MQFKSIKTKLLLSLIACGFMISGVDNFGHIGGLIGGLLCAMSLGIDNKSKSNERIHGTICLILLIGILSYFIFFIKSNTLFF